MDLGGTAFDANQAVAGRQDMSYHLTLPAFSCIRTSFPDGGRRYTIQLVAPLDREGGSARQFWFVGIDKTVADKHGVRIDEMFDYERRIFEEDWPVLANQMPKEPPLDLKLQAHTRADAFSIKYRRTYQDLMRASRAQASPKPVVRTRLEIEGVVDGAAVDVGGKIENS
jgi:hypothetical protein